MSEIVRGRTKSFMTIENYIEDGLLEIGSIDLAGFYGALKRFIDRRNDENSKAVMPWTIDMFCKKFKIGKQRFYKLSEKLWQVGLLDVEKKFGLINPEKGVTGWSNLYVIHDYPDYEGKLRIVRSGSYKYRKDSVKEEGLNHSENQGCESILNQVNKYCSEQENIVDQEDKEEVPYRNTPKQIIEGISNTGIPGTEIPAADISASERYIKDNRSKKQKGSKKQEIDHKSFIHSSIHHDEEDRARARFDKNKNQPVDIVDKVDNIDSPSGDVNPAVESTIKIILTNAGFEGLPVEVEYISRWIDVFPREMIEHAVSKAVLNGKRSLPYIDGIFKDWLKKGIKTIGHAEMETRYDHGRHKTPENGNAIANWGKVYPGKEIKLPDPQIFKDYLKRHGG